MREREKMNKDDEWRSGNRAFFLLPSCFLTIRIHYFPSIIFRKIGERRGIINIFFVWISLPPSFSKLHGGTPSSAPSSLSPLRCRDHHHHQKNMETGDQDPLFFHKQPLQWGFAKVVIVLVKTRKTILIYTNHSSYIYTTSLFPFFNIFFLSSTSFVTNDDVGNDPADNGGVEGIHGGEGKHFIIHVNRPQSMASKRRKKHNNGINQDLGTFRLLWNISLMFPPHYPVFFYYSSTPTNTLLFVSDWRSILWLFCVYTKK